MLVWGKGEGGGDKRFAASVAVVVFIFVAGGEVFGVRFCDFLVGHAVADSGVEFIEGFPLELVVVFGEVAGCLNGAFEC